MKVHICTHCGPTFITFTFIQMCAKSLKGAQHIGEMIADAPQYTESYKEGVLVGGMAGNIKNLSEQDIRSIEAISSLFTSESSIPEIAQSFQTPGGNVI